MDGNTRSKSCSPDQDISSMPPWPKEQAEDRAVTNPARRNATGCRACPHTGSESPECPRRKSDRSGRLRECGRHCGNTRMTTGCGRQSGSAIPRDGRKPAQPRRRPPSSSFVVSSADAGLDFAAQRAPWRAAREDISFAWTVATVFSFSVTRFFSDSCGQQQNTHDPGGYYALTPL